MEEVCSPYIIYCMAAPRHALTPRPKGQIWVKVAKLRMGMHVDATAKVSIVVIAIVEVC